MKKFIKNIHKKQNIENKNINTLYSESKYVPQHKQLNIDPIVENILMKEQQSYKHPILNAGEIKEFGHQMFEPIEQSNVQVEENNDNDESNELYNALLQSDNNSYILLVDNVALCAGPLDQIESEINLLIFGEHELCDGAPLMADRIMVLKKCEFKVGATINNF